MKIYTGTGDEGKSSLFSGERVMKNSPRLDACGEVDELNTLIGALVSVIPDAEDGLIAQLQGIQSHLFRIGALLATSPDSPFMEELERITEEHVQGLEEQIDALEATLSPLSGFLLPGGHMSASWAHMARAVCRRAERRVVSVLADAPAPGSSLLKWPLAYINRLSDFLFVLARHCNRSHGKPDVPWKR
jgi:cob(I)alamin adenosyltransferase